MKRIGIFGVCALLSLGAMAQETVLKAAKKAKGFDEVVKVITPAFSDPSTANLPETYFIPGKAGVDVYLKAANKAMVETNGVISEKDAPAAYTDLLEGYKYLIKAVENVPNAPKPDKKTASETAKLLAEAYEGFNNAGMYFYDHKDYMKAYEAWKIYITLPFDPMMASNKIMQAKAALLSDDTKANYYFNMGICASLYDANGDGIVDDKDSLDLAYDAYIESIKYDNNNKTAYDQALNCAAILGDNEKINTVSELGMTKFGNEEPRFLTYLVQDYLDKNDYNGAIAIVDKAIAANPDVSQYYYVKGFILSQDGVNAGDPEDMFRKAIELDPENDEAYFWLGYSIVKRHDKISDEAPVEPAAYSKVRNEQLIPLLNEARPILEKAYQIKNAKDADLTSIEQLLKGLYYNLGLDEDAELKKIQ